MIDLFRHLPLIDQLLADMTFPVLLGLLLFRRPRIKPTWTKEDFADDRRSQKNTLFAVATAYIGMMALTLYCHLSP